MEHFDVRWRNLRSFVDTGWLHVRPLTILLGSNSSGKSSFLLPFLLLKQTQDAWDEDVALNTRGSLVNAGSYRDIVFQHKADSELSFSFRFQSHMEDTDETALGELPPTEGEMTFVEGSYPGDIDLARYQLRDELGRLLLRRKRTKRGSYSMNSFLDVVKGLTGQDFTPSDDQVKQVMPLLRADRPEHFAFAGSDVFGRFLQEQSEARDKGSRSEGSVVIPEILSVYFSVCRYFTDSLNQLLQWISYVGPIRARFRRVYEVSGEAPPNVGVEGEHTPEVIFQQQDPQLVEDINAWMQRFGFDGQLSTELAGSDAFQMFTGGSNIADVGFGASQVLPLVVQALTSPSNGIMIAEQPEIHLNPRLQTVLADLFASVVAQNKGVLVETHSEHLLLRVRRLIAEGVLGPEDVTLAYVERDGGISTLREVPIGDNGHISPTEWPVGFFEDALSESLALASAQARRDSDR